MAEEWSKGGWRGDPDLLGRLTTAVDEGRTAVMRAGTEADLQKAWLSFKEAIAALEQLAPVPQNTISDFFLSVGKGVVEAQKALDEESKDYLRQKPAMPALFRVPKASAEINFAITSTEKKSFNVLVYSESAETKRLNAQKVSFDVVAVPPPPELFASIGPFLTGRGIRALLQQRLSDHLKTLLQPAQAKSKARLQALVDDFDSVLIFAAPDPRQESTDQKPGHADLWVLVYPYTEADDETPEDLTDYSLEVVAMSSSKPPPSEPDDIRLEAKNWARVHQLGLLLHGLAEEQRASLNRQTAGT